VAQVYGEVIGKKRKLLNLLKNLNKICKVIDMSKLNLIFTSIVLGIVGLIVGFGFYLIITTGNLSLDIEKKQSLTNSTIDLTDFDRLNIATDAKVKIVRSSENKVEITAPKNKIKYIKTTQNNRDVAINTRKKWLIGTLDQQLDTQITIQTTQDLEELELAGNLEIEGIDIFSGFAILDIDGSVKANFDEINSQSLKTVLNGSGDLWLSGRATSAEFKINGSSNISASNLVSESSIVVINVSGNA
jgi:Putative auto-transporter adhesin, head GIN domain